MPKTLRVKLDLREDADFRLVVPTRRKYVVAGTDAVYTVQSDALTGYIDDVDLSTSGLPTGASATIGTDPIGNDGMTDITVETTGTSAGTYEWLVGGTVWTPPEDVYPAASCSLADVQAAINAAGSGDTVTIPAGTATWTSYLTVTKSVLIVGAGVGQTIINNGYNRPSGGSLAVEASLISFNPATPADNPAFRLSGMTVNLDGATSYGLLLRNYTSYDCTKIRIDHVAMYATNKFVFQRVGLMHGVADNCVFEGNFDGGGPDALWSTNGYEFGTISNFYIEDSTAKIWYGEGNGPFRYAFRHNTMSVPTDAQVSPFLGQHGNQYNVQAACFGAELYENDLDLSGNNWNTVFFDQRGGKSLVYNNTVHWSSGSGSSSMGIREEHDDSEGSGVPVNLINGQPQHISDSYYWGNTKNTARFDPSVTQSLTCSICGRVVPTENEHFWKQGASFDGTVGVGVGLLSARPATCTTGVGYWATDESKLYRATSTNVWTLYYTPYTYPHPHRSDPILGD